MERRYFLSAAGGAAAGLALAGCHRQPRTGAGLRPVAVSPEREIRTVVGLRPYRESGFVVRPSDLGGRIVIHNYGHGGAGITLSWGTAAMALEEAVKTGQRRFAVLGCGVNGLSTALLLQRQGFDVSIYAQELPPDTVSNIGGALWFPTTIFNPKVVSAEFLIQFTRACRISQRAFQHYAGDPRYGVWWLRHYFFLKVPSGRDELPGGNDLYPGYKIEQDPERYYGFPVTESFHTLMIDPDIYMRALMRDFLTGGGRIEQRAFNDTDDVLSLPEPVIMNCTGLGTRGLFGDDELVPIRGQLTMLLPQSGINYSYITSNAGGMLYMFPRKGAIVLGGTSDSEQWSSIPQDAERQRMLTDHAEISRRMAGV